MLKCFFIIPVLFWCFLNFAFAAVNINTATVEEFTSLAGIGEVKAKAIVEHRKIHGDFTSVEQIKNVSGIGPKIYLQNVNQMSVTMPTDTKTKTKKKLLSKHKVKYIYRSRD